MERIGGIINMLSMMFLILMCLAFLAIGTVFSGIVIFIVVNLFALAFGLTGITFIQAIALGLVISFVGNVLKTIFEK